MSDQHLIGTEGDDFLVGGDGNDWLEGLGGDDFLYAAEGADLLDGGLGNDGLDAGGGDDFLYGGGGNDEMVGGAGSDTYFFGRGDGQDMIRLSGPGDALAGDRLQFASDIALADVHVMRTAHDLVLEIRDTGERVTVRNHFDVPAAWRLDEFHFGDGAVLNADQIEALLEFNEIFGTQGDDTLLGTDGADRIWAGGGNDVLMGGLGDDLYEMGPGMGYDIVTDTGGNDEIRFGSGVVADELIRWRDVNGDLTLYVPNSADMVRITGWFNSPDHQIERFVFDDGTVWTATEAQSLRLLGTTGDDNFGGSDFGETIYARGGNDVLAGGLGDDVYDMGPGMGYDLVLDSGGDDEVRLGSGVAADELARFRDWNGDLVFYRPYSGDMLRIAGWFNSPENQIERFVFDDGTVWTAEEAGSLRIFGTAGNDFNLTGTQWSERIEGFTGNDWVYSGAGDDVIVLAAAAEPFGFDMVNDVSGDDEVHWQGVSPEQVERIRFNDTGYGSPDLVLRETGTGQMLVLTNWFTDPSFQIERVVFDDGTVWTAEETGALRIFGSAGNDFNLTGTQWSERIEGFTGNDWVYSGAGDDVIVLAAAAEPFGFDMVNDSSGDDEVHWQGVSPEQVERIRFNDTGYGSPDLVLRETGTGQMLVLTNWFTDPSFQIERVVFDDGTVWTAEETGALRIFGSAGNDFNLTGTQWSERIEGFTGNDWVYSGAGDDVIVLAAAAEPFGFDMVNDSSGDDDVHWQGVSPEQVERIRFNDTGYGSPDLVLRETGTGQMLVLTNWFTDPSFQIERVVFDDGTVWTPEETGALRIFGSAGNDFNLTGTQWSERIEGFTGNDWVYSGAGDDVIVLAAAAEPFGFDMVNDSSGDDEVHWQGVSPDQVERIRFNDTGYGSPDLVLRETGTGQMLVLTNWFTDPSFQIERVVFDDGTVWTAEEMQSLRILGTAGDDSLMGTQWSERIEGREGNDQLYGFAGDDILDGGTGNDSMRGGAGDDLYYADSDGDTALEDAGEGVDTVVASVNYQLHWENIENLILVGPNALGGVGNEGNNVITGNDEGNVLAGRGGDDVLIGGAGDDYLVDSGSGNDRLVGGSGNDSMLGLEGDDVYEAGIGQDWIYDNGGDDEVRMAAGITPDQIQREVLGNDLILRVAGTTDSVTLFNWFFDPAFRIERVVFDDGTIWDAETIESGAVIIGTEGDDNLVGTELNDRIEGRGGHDFIQGLGGDDLIDGGEGNDLTDGGTGDDTYLFGLGSGGDSLQEWFGSGTDVLQLGAGIAGGDLAFRGIFNDLTISLPGGLDQVVLRDFLSGGFQNAIDAIRFDDGSQVGIVRADGVQTGYNGGDNVDIFFSSGQAETFWGGQGNDFYVQSGPMGSLNVDTIQDLADGSGGNQLHFANVVPANPFSHLPPIVDYQLSHRNDGYLVISIEGAEWVRLANFNSQDALGAHAVERYSFADGSSISYAQLMERGFDINGGFSFDELHGTNVDDRIHGNQGNDYLWGYEGRDLLYGGSGNDGLDGGDGQDYLEGGAGNDTLLGEDGSDLYYFDRSSGHDWVLELVSLEEGADDVDGIRFGDDIMPEDLIVSLDSLGRFLISIDGSDASILFNAWFNTDILDSRIELFAFQNDTIILTDEQITAMLPDAPVVANPIADQTTAEDAPFSFTVPADAFDDADIPIGDSLAYSARLADGSALPSWLSFDAVTHTFSGTPLNQHVGTLSVEVKATDEHGLSASDVFQLNVTNTNDAPVLAHPIEDQGARESVAFSYTVPADTFVDVDANDTFVYSTSELPSWLSFDAAARTFSGTPGVGDIGSFFNVEVTVQDGHGAQASDTFEFNVDAAPDQEIIGTDGDDTLTGGSGNDSIDGLAGHDTMSGGLGNDTYFVDHPADRVNEAPDAGLDFVMSTSWTYTLDANVENLVLLDGGLTGIGNDLDNVIVGNDASNNLGGGGGADTLVDGSGDDYLDGGSGADMLVGGTDDDQYWVDNEGDVVVEYDGEGGDIVFSVISYTLGDAVESLYLMDDGTAPFEDIDGTGNALANFITGSQGNNVLRGLDGDDMLHGREGDDVLFGDAGADNLSGDDGHDTLYGGDGDDIIDGGDQSDVLYGDAGDDLLFGGGAYDILYGGDGNDRLNDGNELYGEAGDDDLFGDDFDDLLYGGEGNDKLFGGDGNDFLDGGEGSDIMSGDDGDDTYVLENAGEHASETPDGGNDTVQVTFSYNLIMAQYVENITLLGAEAINATGNSGANVLKGNAAANVLNGGAGNDTYYIGVGDTMVDSGGTDTVVSEITWTLASNFENLTLGGTEAIDGTGNSLNNILVGNIAANVLRGGSGGDTYYVGAGDTIIENASGGTDVVFADANWILSDNVEQLTLIGDALVGIGNGQANTITGNAGDNFIDGGGGSDNMTGGAGNDTYVVNQQGDSVNDSSGIDTVIASINYQLGSSVENLTLSGTGNLTGSGNGSNNVLTGNSGSNTLTGNIGNDTIDGGGGNDRIEGDPGNDTLTGGAGADSFVFENVGASHADVVTDFEAIDRLLLDNSVMTALGVNGNFSNNDARFWASAAGTAHDASDRIVYNTDSGQLWYDADGTGSAAAQLIATLQNDPALLASQISVI